MLIPASAGAGASPVPATYALSIGSQADQLGLTGTQFAAPTATKNGVPIAITAYAWTVTGPCTLDNAAIAQPTPTGTGAGTCTRQLAATLADGAVVYSAMDGWTVGDADGRVQTHAVDWTAAGNAGTHTGATITKDGIDLTFTSGGGSAAVASEGVGLVFTAGTGVSFSWAGNDLGSSTMDTTSDVVWYFAISANIASAADDIGFTLQDASGANRLIGLLSYSAGHLVGACARRASGSYVYVTKSVASQARVLAMRFSGGAVAEIRYSLTAYSGTWPAFSAMSKVFATRTSNKFSALDLATASDTADAPVLAGSIGRFATHGTDCTLSAHAIYSRSTG